MLSSSRGCSQVLFTGTLSRHVYSITLRWQRGLGATWVDGLTAVRPTFHPLNIKKKGEKGECGMLWQDKTWLVDLVISSDYLDTISDSERLYTRNVLLVHT